MSFIVGSIRRLSTKHSSSPLGAWRRSSGRLADWTTRRQPQPAQYQRTITLASEWIKLSADDSAVDENADVFVFLHGLLGNRRNLQTLAKTLCERVGRRGLMLDIRGHGGSQLQGSKRDEPTTLQDCAEDVYETLQPHAQDLGRVRWTLVGHSLGGRVSMLYALQQEAAAQNTTTGGAPQSPPLLPQNIWLLDTVPGALDASVRNVVDLALKLENSSDPLPRTRSKLVNALVEEEGLSMALAQWLASSFNLKTRSFSFDLKVVQEIMADFDEAQFMEWIKAEPVPVDLVRGASNKAWEGAAGHLEELENWHEEGERELRIHLLQNAGHWLHMDDLKGVVDIVADRQRDLDNRT